MSDLALKFVSPSYPEQNVFFNIITWHIGHVQDIKNITMGIFMASEWLSVVPFLRMARVEHYKLFSWLYAVRK